MSDLHCKTMVARDKLAMEIRAGELAHGSSFPSRRALCERFDISPMTAHKIQQSLLEMGLIQKRCGESFIVTSDRIPAMDLPSALRKVCFIYPMTRGFTPSRWIEALDGCRAACEERGLEFRTEFFECFEREENFINTSRAAAPDEGYVIVLRVQSTMREVLGLLLSPRTRVVLLNAVFPERASVLTDNRHGIRELLACARRHGASRVMMAGCFALSFPIVNESERLEGFMEIAREMGLTAETDCSGNYQTIFEHARVFRPDVLLFTRDDKALRFREEYAAQLKHPVRCFGFDDIVEESSRGYAPITTYRVDCRAFGYRAVAMLNEPSSEFIAPPYMRVQGELCDREK